MDKVDLRNALKRYIELVARVRLLSAPEIGEIKGAEVYRDCLITNFTEIGEMSEEIKSLLDEVIYPLLDSDELLTSEQESALFDFSKALVNTSTINYLDPMLCYRIADRLLSDAEKKSDESLLVRALDNFVDSSYIVMLMALRLNPCSNAGYGYREKGLKVARKILEYLDENRFAALSDDESKSLVLINSRYINALAFRAGPMEEEDRVEMLSFLYDALELEQKTVYSEALPSYSWARHRFRTYQYLISCTEMNNVCGLTKEELATAYTAFLKLKDMWDADEGGCHSLCPKSTVNLYEARITYLNDLISAEEYKEKLRTIYENADANDFGLHGIISNVFVIDEYLLAVRETGTTEDDRKCLAKYYRSLISYLSRMPKEGSIIFACNIMADIIKDYVDIPEYTFISFCTNLIVAIHPPTFVHTMTMTSIVSCLTSHLMQKKPELFAKYLKCDNAEDIKAREDEALGYAEQSALAHDIGKLFVIEYIMMYGRNLFDEEFAMIRKHPDIGAYVLKKHKDSRDFQALAAAHHFRFEDLPAKAAEGLFESAEIPFISVATCADALDAATDTVGRSYKKGKSLEVVIDELREGSGKFYAPYVVELFEDPKVVEDVRRILSEGREDNYRKAYETLSSLAKVEA